MNARRMRLACVSLLWAAPALAAERTAAFEYSGWHCARCGPRIEKALGRTKAVKKATVTLDRVTVVYDDRFEDLDGLARRIEEAGPYKVSAKRMVEPTPTPPATPALPP